MFSNPQRYGVHAQPIRVIRSTELKPIGVSQPGNWRLTVKMPRGAKRRDVYRTFDWTCDCSHDGCLHIQQAVTRAWRRKGREWLVEIRTFYNV